MNELKLSGSGALNVYLHIVTRLSHDSFICFVGFRFRWDYFTPNLHLTFQLV